MAKRSKPNTPTKQPPNDVRAKVDGPPAPALRAPPTGYKRMPVDSSFWAGRDTFCALLDVERGPSPRMPREVTDLLICIALEPTLVRDHNGVETTIAKMRPFRVADPELQKFASLLNGPESAEKSAFVMLLQRGEDGRPIAYVLPDAVPLAELATFDPAAPRPARPPAPPAAAAATTPAQSPPS